MLVVELTPVDGGLTVRSADIRPRDVTLSSDVPRVISSARDEREYFTLHAELLAQRTALPDGSMPCDLRAWSNVSVPNGLN
ncbi:MAG: Bacterial domain, partial [Tardiphaga sp.]|nr:Bacterial domain [Tardiphaga sp.]